MARDIFGDVVRPRAKLGSARSTVLLSVTLHLALAIAIVVVPLVATDSIPTPSNTIASFIADPAPPPPPPPPPAAPSTARTAATSPAAPSVAPSTPPSAIHEETPAAVPAASVGVVEGLPSGVAHGTGSVIPINPSLPPPPTPVKQAPLRAGSLIKSPTKVKDVRPVYPAIAQSSRVEGRVIIEATIGTDGRVTETKVLKSVTLLDAAAVEAVREWRFTPTLLNGVPVPVILVVTVDFTLK